MIGKLLWLTYRKLRPAFGIPFAFVLMAGAFFGILGSELLLVALGFLFIDLFGNFYNDYWDFVEDKENKRRDKFTTLGFVSPRISLYISFVLAAIGIFFLLHGTPSLFSVGISYLFLLLIYSHKKIRLKGRLAGYALVSSPFFILPLAIASSYGLTAVSALPLSLFFFSQCIYILCQKDSTDLKDKNNIFISYGCKKAFKVTALFAALSSLSLFLIASLYPVLFLAWCLNLVSKTMNLDHIWRNSITKEKRSNFVLLEFISHYLSIGGVVLA